MASTNFIKNLGSKMALATIRFYQLFISQLLPANHCRFTPSCSEFMYQAIVKKGLIRGCYLGTRRLLHCHPFSKKSGFDSIE